MNRIRQVLSLVVFALLTAVAVPEAVAQAQTNAEQQACWICSSITKPVEEGGSGWPYRWCDAGTPGSYNCQGSWFGTCVLSSPGCGAQALQDVEIDGSIQYASAGMLQGESRTLQVVRRACDQAIVFRPAKGASVRPANSVIL